MTIKFDTEHEKALREISNYRLSMLADCGEPRVLANSRNYGAEFLDTVRESVIEAFSYDSWGTYPEDVASQIADSCVPVYNNEIAETWADVAGWSIDIDGLGEGTTDIIKLMSISLYVAGERLANALYNEYKHTLEELEGN
jgi:hypothetical protein